MVLVCISLFYVTFSNTQFYIFSDFSILPIETFTLYLFFKKEERKKSRGGKVDVNMISVVLIKN